MAEPAQSLLQLKPDTTLPARGAIEPRLEAPGAASGTGPPR
jgi:hypothetical protein